MKVLLTGSSGFVGSHLVGILRTKGFDVITDSGDLSVISSWKHLLSGCDAVIHLAARVHQMHETLDDPFVEYKKINTDATLELARAALEFGCNHFVFLSSIKVNGEGQEEAYKETDLCNPSDPYGQSKFFAEQGLEKIAQESHLKVSVIRPPLLYGKGVRANFLSLIKMVEKGLPLPFKGIHNKRSFLGVRNLCDFIVHLLESKKTCPYSLYLLSDGEDLSTHQLVSKIAAVLGVSNRSFYFPPVLLKWGLSVVGMKRFYDRLGGNLTVDSSHARTRWCPPYSVEDELKRIFEK